eukprot:TRINITY_DN7656_c0_g1_i1.p1 TRINITY_DN7656_c0_g1~~TRINITY_DN7656_c0_g1_i1.p1  ORF type:complete len:773 (-),score=161.67 TRINITY_DN7656_c0_g1_i1:577-2895(-)
MSSSQASEQPQSKTSTTTAMDHTQIGGAQGAQSFGYYPEYVPRVYPAPGPYGGLYPAPYALPYQYSYNAPYTNQAASLDQQSLLENLTRQIEYYFSRSNLASDVYLVSQMDNDLFVPISIIAGFKMVQRMTGDINLVLQAMKASSSLIVDEKNMKVKPNIKHRRTTLILRDVPSSFATEQLEALFQSGSVKPVSIRPDVKETWFVEFETEEETSKAFDFVRTQSIEGHPINARIKSETLLRTATILPSPDSTSPKGFAPAQQSFIQPQYKYYNSSSWRPPVAGAYGYPPQAYDPNVVQRQGSKGFGGTRGPKGSRVRRESGRTEVDQGQSILPSPGDLARQVSPSHLADDAARSPSAVQSNVSQQTQEPTDSSPPQVEITTNTSADSSSAQEHATESLRTLDLNQETSKEEEHVSTHAPKSKALPPRSSATNQVADSSAKALRKKKGKREGDDSTSPSGVAAFVGGESKRSQGNALLQPADFPPLSATGATKANTAVIRSSGYSSEYKSYTKNQLLDIIGTLEVPQKPEPADQHANPNISLDEPIKGLLVSRTEQPKPRGGPKATTWGDGSKVKDRAEHSKQATTVKAATQTVSSGSSSEPSSKPNVSQTTTPAMDGAKNSSTTQQTQSERRSRNQDAHERRGGRKEGDRPSNKGQKSQETVKMQISVKTNETAPKTESVGVAVTVALKSPQAIETEKTISLPTETTETSSANTGPASEKGDAANQDSTPISVAVSNSNKKSYAAVAAKPSQIQAPSTATAQSQQPKPQASA